MPSELESLHNAIIDQLKETATNSYNSFYQAYEELSEHKDDSRIKFLNIIRNNDYVISSLSFYDDKFKDLDRSEDYLYIAQILSLQIKACHNLYVIDNDDKWLTRKEEYKSTLYHYYELGKNITKIGPILEAFIKDAGIKIIDK